MPSPEPSFRWPFRVKLICDTVHGTVFYLDPERESHMKKQRALARELRASQWWKSQVGPGCCYHCKQKFPSSELTMDHLIPIALGGKSNRANVVPSCRPCNQAKGHKLNSL